MKINTNSWNKFRYTIYAPGYDLLGRYFKEPRRRSIESIVSFTGLKVLADVDAGFYGNFRWIKLTKK
jgi:hypothetical protein